jgi:hypothetical protein
LSAFVCVQPENSLAVRIAKGGSPIEGVSKKDNVADDLPVIAATTGYWPRPPDIEARWCLARLGGNAALFPRFQRVRVPDKSEQADIVCLISQRAGRCLERLGLLEQDAESAWLELGPADDTDALPHIMGSSISFRLTVSTP